MNYGGLANFVFTMIAIPVVITSGFFVIAAVPSWRQHWRQKHSALFALLAVIAIPTALAIIWLVVQFLIIDAKHKHEEARLNPISQQATRVAGVLFPAGSQLHYEANSDGSTTAIAAESATPITAGNLSITGIQVEYGRTVVVKLSGDNTIEGLPCKNKADFLIYPDSKATPPDNWQLQFCELNPLQQYGEFDWPASSTVAHHSDGWVLTALEHLPPDLSREGFKLQTSFQMWLDQQQKPQEWASYLAAETKLGVMQYPAGTEIQWLANGNLIFSPNRQPAINSQLNTEISDLIVQTTSGKIIGTFNTFETAHQAASPSAKRVQ